MIVGLRGKQGNGKTATLAWLAHHYHKLGYKIHANFHIHDIDFHYVTCIEDIENIHDGYFLADEFWTWLDSRVSAHSDVNLVVTSILMKARKRGYSLFYESKLIHMMDRRIREQTDYVLEPGIYYEDDCGNLVRIKQSMLNPVDVTPYLDRLWVVVDKFEFAGEVMFPCRGDDEEEIMFKLTEVMNTYDTKEEIGSLADGEKSPGIEKGKKIENALANYLQANFPEAEITVSENSGQYTDMLDVELKIGGKTYVFDSVSPKNKGEKRSPQLDFEGKKYVEKLETYKHSKIEPWIAFKDNGGFKFVRLTHALAKRRTITLSKLHNVKTLEQLGRDFRVGEIPVSSSEEKAVAGAKNHSDITVPAIAGPEANSYEVNSGDVKPCETLIETNNIDL